MARSSSLRRLDLWMNGERVGAWMVGADGDALIYDAAWLASAQGRPLSLSLPLQPGNRSHHAGTMGEPCRSDNCGAPVGVIASRPNSGTGIPSFIF